MSYNPLNLEEYRSYEFAWHEGEEYEVARMRSTITEVAYSFLRGGLPDKWYREVERLFRDIGITFVGSPMQHGLRAYVKYRASMIRALIRNQIEDYPLRVGYDHPRENKQGMAYRHGAQMLWRPKTKWNTDFFTVDTYHPRQMQNAKAIIKEFQMRDGEIDPAMRDTLRDLLKSIERETVPYIVAPPIYLPKSQHPEQIEASDYHAECVRWQATKAGRKARRLLLENLTDAQREMYFKEGFFLVIPEAQEDELHKRRIYAVQRGFPNGNVQRVKHLIADNGKGYWFSTQTFCFHTEEPHAIDDILLGQKLMLEHREPEFLAQAHKHDPHENVPVQYLGNGY